MPDENESKRLSFLGFSIQSSDLFTLVIRVAWFGGSALFALGFCKVTGHTDKISFAVAFITILMSTLMLWIRYKPKR